MCNVNFFFTEKDTIRLAAYKKKHINKLIHCLQYIRETDNIEYLRLCRRIDTVLVTDKKNGNNIFYMPERCWITNNEVLEISPIAWCAALLVHEGYHAIQYRDGWTKSMGENIEEPATEYQIKFLRKTNIENSMKIEWIKHLRKQFDNHYWEPMDEDHDSISNFQRLRMLLKEDRLIFHAV